jgi:hypothetical protein
MPGIAHDQMPMPWGWLNRAASPAALVLPEAPLSLPAMTEKVAEGWSSWRMLLLPSTVTRAISFRPPNAMSIVFVPVDETSVVTALVRRSILRINELPRSTTRANVMSDEMTTPWGLLKVAADPMLFAEPAVPEPAINEETLAPEVRVSLRTRWLVYSVKIANVPSDEISIPDGSLRRIAEPVPSAYPRALPVRVVTAPVAIMILRMAWFNWSVTRA